MAGTERKDQIGSIVGLIGGVIGAVSGLYTFTSQLRPARLNIYPHGIFDYAAPNEQRCLDSHLEFITAPLTLINEGGRSGIIANIYMEIRSTADGGSTRRFMASAIGQWRPGTDRCSNPENMKHFAPIMIKGGEAVRESIIFFPVPTRPHAPRIVQPNKKYTVSISAQEYRSTVLGIHNQEANTIQIPIGDMVVGPFTGKEAENGLVAIHSPLHYIIPGSATK